MKKFLIQSILLILLITLGILFYKGVIPEIPFLPKPPHQSVILINDNKINVEIADTPSTRSKGLGGRDSLASDSGILFIFPKQDKYPFWMKRLKFPLDFVWIKGDKVVDIILNAKPPPQGASDDSLPVYLPHETVDKVLEVNAGVVDRLHIKVGDNLKIVGP